MPVARRSHAPFTRSIVVAFAAMLLVAANLTSGCAPAALSALPKGVVVDVFQGRFDIADHMLEVAVANGTTDDLVVTELSFSSPTFHPKSRYLRAPTTIRSGQTTNLRLELPQADCRATPGPPVVTTSFNFRGTPGGATVSPLDRIGHTCRVARLHGNSNRQRRNPGAR